MGYIIVDFSVKRGPQGGREGRTQGSQFRPLPATHLLPSTHAHAHRAQQRPENSFAVPFPVNG